MTALIGTSANLMAGIREFGQVTNSYAGFLQSGGVAYDLTLPFQADCLQWWNYTKYGTNSQNLQGIWFRDFPAGDALIVARGTTDLTSALETSNGVTINNTSAAFTNQHLAISNITAATPGVVTTSTNHGLSDGDRVYITKVIGSLGASVNNKEFVVDVRSATTFALQDIYGNNYTTSGTYTSGGQVTIEGPDLDVQMSQPVYKLTLGSAVMANDNDVIYFIAYKFNSYYNLGDVA